MNRYDGGTDVTTATLFDLDDVAEPVDLPVNAVPTETDSNLLNTNALVVPVTVASLGLPAGRTAFTYTVTTISQYTGQVLDSVGPLAFDTQHQRTGLGSTVLVQPDLPGPVTVVRDAAGTTPDLGLMLLHLHGTDDRKAEVVPVTLRQRSGDHLLRAAAVGPGGRRLPGRAAGHRHAGPRAVRDGDPSAGDRAGARRRR